MDEPGPDVTCHPRTRRARGRSPAPLAWVLLLAFAAIAVAPSSAPARSKPAASKPAATKAAPRRVELVQGKSVDLGDGVRVVLKSVMYAHLSESRNESRMILTATR